jgi:hypothetical protein
MNEMKVARGLGWLSVGLGLAEVAAGRALGRALGMEDRSGLLRLYGLREIASGAGILASDRPAPWVWARVAGDVLDLATLASAYTEDNPGRDNVAAAFASVAGITWLDLWCARRLHSARPHGSMRTHRRYVADGPTRRAASGEFPAAGPG